MGFQQQERGTWGGVDLVTAPLRDFYSRQNPKKCDFLVTSSVVAAARAENELPAGERSTTPDRKTRPR